MNGFFRVCSVLLVFLSFMNFSCAGTGARTGGKVNAEAAETGHVVSFVFESHYAVPDGEVAEIVTATPDGRFLYYTNASGKKIGVLDITDPAEPRALPPVSTGGAEPTSAAVSPDGRYLIAVMRNGDGLDNPVPDNARSPSVIWKLDMSKTGEGQVEIVQEIPLTKDGKAAA